MTRPATGRWRATRPARRVRLRCTPGLFTRLKRRRSEWGFGARGSVRGTSWLQEPKEKHTGEASATRPSLRGRPRPIPWAEDYVNQEGIERVCYKSEQPA